MKNILPYFAMLVALLISTAACGDDMLDKIKNTDNFKNADAVFVGRVIKVRGRGPVFADKQLAGAGPKSYFAEIVIEKNYKGDLRNKEIVAIDYPYDETRKANFLPLFQQEKKYLVFGKKVPATKSDDFIDLSLGNYYFQTSNAMGTIYLK